jgi:hypothetical protein
MENLTIEVVLIKINKQDVLGGNNRLLSLIRHGPH